MLRKPPHPRKILRIRIKARASIIISIRITGTILASAEDFKEILKPHKKGHIKKFIVQNSSKNYIIKASDE